jgi:uncharacterized surface protein with fasciclin (FAS1) repeats
MHIARPSLAIASPVLTIALLMALMTAAFSSVAQTSPARAADCCGGTGATSTTLAPDGPSGTATATTLAGTANLSEFSRLISAAGLKPRLKRAEEAYTVFAPTNEAFNKMPVNVRDRILRPDNPGLKALLRSHIIKGSFTYEQLTDGQALETIDGRIIHVARQADGTVLLDGVYRLRDTGRTTTNGVIYALDTVIAPQ